MDHICVVFPLLPGKTEDARAFQRELDTERKAEYEKGAQVDLMAIGAPDERDNQANLITARQSPGYLLVKEMIARMESDYQAARLLWLRSGFLKNRGRRSTRETGLAKWFATVASERAAGDAVQVHGANGYSDEYPVGRFYRNCKGAVIYEGTREIHTLMQADYVLGFREDRPTRCELPAIEADTRQ